MGLLGRLSEYTLFTHGIGPRIMTVAFARPDVSDLMFRLYGRSIHPELFTTYAESKIEQNDYVASIRVCDAGHVISFCSRGQTISEITAARKHPLPQKKRYIEKKLRGSRDASITFDCGLQYHVSYQLEQLDPEVFLNFHEELLIDCNRAEVAHRFPGGNRLSPCPLSFIQTDVGPNSLLIHAYHTFPENCAVVKTQSLFEV